MDVPGGDFGLHRCARSRETERQIVGTCQAAVSRPAVANAQRNDRPGHFLKALRISLAAFWPDPAVMPPPGWVPAPHK